MEQSTGIKYFGLLTRQENKLFLGILCKLQPNHPRDIRESAARRLTNQDIML